MTAFKTLLKNFRSSQKGTTAIIMALSAVPLMIAAGMGLDFIRASNLKAHLQGAIDAAALAAAASPGLPDSERIRIAEKAFAVNWRHAMTIGIDATPVFRIEKGAVTASVKTEMPTSLMNIAGIDILDISGATTVKIPEDKKAEIALVLDYSGSMTEISGGQVKYVAMKKAAKRLVEDLKITAPKRVKIGLVPFSHHVWLSLPKEYVKGQAGTGTWTGCTQDRLSPYNLQDSTPNPADDMTKWGQPLTQNNHGGCGPYSGKNLIVKPLTSDLASVTEQLDKMEPYAYTHIALGVEFGWHLLSPNAPFVGTAAYDDANTGKVMVVLTDGRQTEPAFGPNGVRTVAQGEKNLSSLCKGAKARGITMITVAFDLQDEDTRNRLRDCATDPVRHFFVAEDSADLARAFEEIKTQITASVFISK
jgi:Flp pilus assembly protein TadG